MFYDVGIGVAAVCRSQRIARLWCGTLAVASWPGMPEYVFEDIRSSVELPAAYGVRQGNHLSPRAMIIQPTPKTQPYGKFSLLKHTA